LPLLNGKICRSFNFNNMHLRILIIKNTQPGNAFSNKDQNRPLTYLNFMSQLRQTSRQAQCGATNIGTLERAGMCRHIQQAQEPPTSTTPLSDMTRTGETPGDTRRDT
jgi:hypothetical protein